MAVLAADWRNGLFKNPQSLPPSDDDEDFRSAMAIFPDPPKPNISEHLAAETASFSNSPRQNSSFLLLWLWVVGGVGCLLFRKLRFGSAGSPLWCGRNSGDGFNRI